MIAVIAALLSAQPVRSLDFDAAPAPVAAPASAAFDDGCIFDGCAPRSSSPPPAAGEGSALRQLTRWEGAKKGAEEGALLGFMGTLRPALALADDGLSRRMSRAYDGERPENAGGASSDYGGFLLAALLYLPALVVGGLAAAGGALIGAASPQTADDWDAERALFDRR